MGSGRCGVGLRCVRRRLWMLLRCGFSFLLMRRCRRFGFLRVRRLRMFLGWFSFLRVSPLRMLLPVFLACRKRRQSSPKGKVVRSMEIAYFMNFTSNGDTRKPIASWRVNLC